MEDIYLNINDILTHVKYCGGALDGQKEEVIVCITGNPGLPGFYDTFALALYEKTKRPVCVIGHAGHEESINPVSNTLENQEHLFNLDGQLKHKIAFIENFLNNAKKVHLIGHSIGAWIVVEMLEHKYISEKAKSGILIFPTLQYMADTRNGFIINKIIRNIHSLVLMLVTIFAFLPLKAREFLIKGYLKLNSSCLTSIPTVLEYLQPLVIEKVLFLAYNEMDKVMKLNSNCIKKNQNKICIIYGKHDGWAPVKYFDRMRQIVPDMEMLQVDIDHAFVMNSSEEVAEIIYRTRF